MKIWEILAAAGFAALLASGAQAQTCSLAQMASLDMTALPDGRFTVPVSINGTMHPFMVDTGGVFSKIAPGVAQKLGLSEGPTRAEIYGAVGKLHLSVVDVDSFKVGNNEAKRFHLAVTDDDTDPQGGVDGVLGPDLLILFDVELDFREQQDEPVFAGPLSGKGRLLDAERLRGIAVPHDLRPSDDEPAHRSDDNARRARPGHYSGHRIADNLVAAQAGVRAVRRG